MGGGWRRQGCSFLFLFDGLLKPKHAPPPHSMLGSAAPTKEKLEPSSSSSELIAFYHEVHRKLRDHYPSNWLLVSPKQEQQADTGASTRKEQLEKEEEGDEAGGLQLRELTPARRPTAISTRRKRARIEIELEEEEESDAAGSKRTGQHSRDASEQQKKRASRRTNVCGGQRTVLSSLISTVLSQNTTDRNSSAAWASLQGTYQGTGLFLFGFGLADWLL